MQSAFIFPILLCSSSPSCGFTEPYAAAVQQLVSRQQAPTTEPLSRQALAKELRALIVGTHSDKRQEIPVATLPTQAVVALCERLPKDAW
jgi:hypothetical protein